MWKDIFSFELRYQLRQPLLAVSAGVFFLLAVALAASDVGVAIGSAPGTTLRNAPLVILHLMPVVSLLGLFVITAFVASSALRDSERHSDMLFFTKPVSKLDYLGGRFAGSMVVSSWVLLTAVGGLMVAYLMPWQPADRLAPFSMGPYLYGLSVLVIPNLLVMGALFFALAIWSRRPTLTYICAVFFIGMQDVIEVIAQSLDNPLLGSLIEPSGIVALETMTRYWTIAEQNTRLPDVGGVLLANRLVWLGIAFAALAFSVARFDFTTRERSAKKPKNTSLPSEATRHDLTSQSSRTLDLPSVRRGSTRGDLWRHVLHQTKLEISEVISGAPFLTLLALGLMFVVAISLFVGSYDGMPSYPLTHLMLIAIRRGVQLTLMIILVIYAGELVFSQRSLRLSEVYDALPVPNWVFLGAKLLALMSIIGVFLLAAVSSTLLVQLGKGFFQPDFGLYLKGLAIIAWPLVLLVVLMIFLQVLTNHKLLGLLSMVIVLLLRFALPRLGLENNLYLFASHPALRYTGFNGYGHHAEPFLWYMIYWTFVTLVLGVAAFLLWPRGTEVSLRERLDLARRRLTRPALAVATVGVLGMVTSGGWIFYNTHLRNDYLTRDGIMQRLADYEQTYQQYRDVPLPRVTSVFAEVDIYPDQRQVAIRGRYRLENQSSEPVSILPITISPRWVEGVLRVYGGVSLEDFELPPHRVLIEDRSLGFYVVELSQPLLQGDFIDFGFTMKVDHRGFVNRRHNNLVVDNGTFFSNTNFFPTIGYSRSNQLLNPSERQKRGMSPIERVPKVDDREALERNYLDADWIQFETIVSTRSDQIALAPGDLEKEWTDGGRRFFHYKTTQPIVNLLPFVSGRYEVVRDRWQDIDIEVYFHPEHDYNIERFVETTKRSLDYMTTHFGPYPHDQLRIVEIPGYDGEIAFAFAQTIPFSETWAFTSNLDAMDLDAVSLDGADLDGVDLDWLTGILAHEVSHQWWNHQVVPGDVQGATLIAESLAQYSAMMILQEMYGPETVRHFLKFHLDRYLERRGNEQVREMPLSLVENQAYIHYSKASLAFYALEDLIGEASLNEALRAFLEETAFQGPPYASSLDLLTHLRRVVPGDKEHLIEDLFETITLFDNRVVEGEFIEQDDGTFLVELETSMMKLRGDGLGDSTEIAIDDWVDIGVFGQRDVDGKTQETVLVLDKRHVQTSTGKFTFVVDERPVRAGIDPYNKLIDRDSGDNIRTLTERSRP